LLRLGKKYYVDTGLHRKKGTRGRQHVLGKDAVFVKLLRKKSKTLRTTLLTGENPSSPAEVQRGKEDLQPKRRKGGGEAKEKVNTESRSNKERGRKEERSLGSKRSWLLGEV